MESENKAVIMNDEFNPSDLALDDSTGRRHQQTQCHSVHQRVMHSSSLFVAATHSKTYRTSQRLCGVTICTTSYMSTSTNQPCLHLWSSSVICTGCGSLQPRDCVGHANGRMAQKSAGTPSVSRPTATMLKLHNHIYFLWSFVKQLV